MNYAHNVHLYKAIGIPSLDVQTMAYISREAVRYLIKSLIVSHKPRWEWFNNFDILQAFQQLSSRDACGISK